MRPLDKPSTNTPKSNSRNPPSINRDAYARAPSLFTPRTPKPIPPRARPPLRTRDSNQNAPSLNRPATTTRAAFSTRPTFASAQKKTNMPVGGGGDNLRPRQPQLSAAVARAATRPPLTPKVASSKSSVTTTTTQSAVTPLSARRLPNDGGPPFLGNITPRTGPRQTRVESAGSTPTGTPNPERGFDGWDAPKMAGSGVGTPGTDVGKFVTQAEDKFFHASDARPKSLENTQQRPASVPQKPATFFYANGPSAEAKRTTSPPSGPMFTPVLASTPEPTSTKFFYANGVPDQQPLRPGMTTSASTSTVSTNSRIAHQRPSTGSSAPILGPSAGSRPMSPVKSATPSAVSSLQGSALPPGPAIRPSITSPPSLAPTSNPNGKRRVSIEAPTRERPPFHRGHSRTGSVPTLDQLIVPKYARSPQSPEGTMSPPLSPGLTRPAMTMASLLQAAEDLQGDDDSKDDDSYPDAPQSPTKSAYGGDPISELVANARRERKVQDLEITNASLEAINRTLERQLRKQTAELRRYRRLSRSGRLSAPPSRVASAAMTEPPIDLSDLSERDGSGEDELDSMHDSDFSSDDADSTDELSADGKMAARRKRDEMRLQLDLTKHQELLIDSQKINQSIMRCLDWSDALIKEGNKALEYHVRVSDVELGGKVLVPADEEDDGDVSFQPDTPSKPPSSSLEAPLEEPAQQGRDSGVELPPSAD